MGRRRFDALFIDFYGTITTGDRQAVEDTSRSVVEDLHLPVSAPDFAIEWGNRFFAAADDRNHGRFRNLFEIECDTLIETLADYDVHGVDPAPYIDQLVAYWSDPELQPDSVEALRSIDVPVCVVSNADTKDLLAAIERHDLRFDHVLTSQDARCYKPAPAIFERALEMVGLPPERVAHAGDSLHADVSGAAPLGITTIWVCRTGRIHDVGTAKPDHKISSLMGLRDIIR
jgi:2-haloacid dehalogenase/putative hydrolase of the HAD superfamily